MKKVMSIIVTAVAGNFNTLAAAKPTGIVETLKAFGPPVNFGPPMSFGPPVAFGPPLT